MSSILLAYLLLSRGAVTGESRLYHWLNLLGVIGVGMNVFVQKAWPALGLQAAFGLIAIYALIKIQKNKNKGGRNAKRLDNR